MARLRVCRQRRSLPLPCVFCLPAGMDTRCARRVIPWVGASRRVRRRPVSPRPLLTHSLRCAAPVPSCLRCRACPAERVGGGGGSGQLLQGGAAAGGDLDRRERSTAQHSTAQRSTAQHRRPEPSWAACRLNGVVGRAHQGWCVRELLSRSSAGVHVCVRCAADRPHGWMARLHLQPDKLPAARDAGERGCRRSLSRRMLRRSCLRDAAPHQRLSVPPCPPACLPALWRHVSPSPRSPERPPSLPCPLRSALWRACTARGSAGCR